MTCAVAREMFALHIEGDLTAADATAAIAHLEGCSTCREFIEDLRARQQMLKSLRHEMASASECAGMRRDVMAIINGRNGGLGIPLRIERALVLGLRQHSYALATLVLLAAVSVSLFAKMPQPTPQPYATATFTGSATLHRPQGYRDWIAMNRPSEARAGQAVSAHQAPHTVYVEPRAYREYGATGRLPEGTVLIWESTGSAAPTLLASVKDSTRFEGGWGFFDFSTPNGALAATADALPTSSGCHACHREEPS